MFLSWDKLFSEGFLRYLHLIDCMEIDFPLEYEQIVMDKLFNIFAFVELSLFKVFVVKELLEKVLLKHL